MFITRKRTGLIFLFLILLILPWVLPPYPLQLMVLVGIFCILTMSLNFISGFAGLISLGHAGFFLVGSYTSALLAVNLGSSFWLAVPAAVAITGVSGLALGFPALRWSGHFLAVITIAFGQILQLLSINLVWLTNGIDGVSRIPRPSMFGYTLRSDASYYYLVGVAVFLVFMMLHYLVDSGFGRSLKAIRDDETAAACMGIDVNRAKIVSFVLSAGVAGFAGALYAPYLRFINPDSYSIDISIRIFVMMIIGGIGSLPGSLIGAISVYLLPEVLRFLEEIYFLIWGLLVIGIMLFLPGGLVSLLSPSQRAMSFWHLFTSRRSEHTPPRGG